MTPTTTKGRSRHQLARRAVPVAPWHPAAPTALTALNAASPNTYLPIGFSARD
jgi:hypothetical protein